MVENNFSVVDAGRTARPYLRAGRGVEAGVEIFLSSIEWAFGTIPLRLRTTRAPENISPSPDHHHSSPRIVLPRHFVMKFYHRARLHRPPMWANPAAPSISEAVTRSGFASAVIVGDVVRRVILYEKSHSN